MGDVILAAAVVGRSERKARSAARVRKPRVSLAAARAGRSERPLLVVQSEQAEHG